MAHRRWRGRLSALLATAALVRPAAAAGPAAFPAPTAAAAEAAAASARTLTFVSKAAAGGIAWVLAEGPADCGAVCQRCGGRCLESDGVWPSGFAWRCSAGIGRACTERFSEAPQDYYSLQREPLCGWEADNAALNVSQRSCAASGRHTAATVGPAATGGDAAGADNERRFCPCEAPRVEASKVTLSSNTNATTPPTQTTTTATTLSAGPTTTTPMPPETTAAPTAAPPAPTPPPPLGSALPGRPPAAAPEAGAEAPAPASTPPSTTPTTSTASAAPPQQPGNSSSGAAGPAARGQKAAAARSKKGASGGYSCRFRVDDHLRGVWYARDVTDEVTGGSAWNSTRHLSFMPVPGAYLVVYGEDEDGDFFNKGGFWADCDFAPKARLSEAWEAFCSREPIDAEHLKGSSWGWNQPAFRQAGLWAPGTLGEPGKSHCVFRTMPMKVSGYSCDIKVDDYVRSVAYNGMDITTTVAGDLNRWNALRRVSFPPVPGAYVVIYGEDWKGDFYEKGGFWADCDTAPSSQLARSSWQSFCSATAIDPEHRTGLGTGWKRPTFHASSHGEPDWAPGTLGDAGAGHCAFRMIPVRASATRSAEPQVGPAKPEAPTTSVPSSGGDTEVVTVRDIPEDTEAPAPEGASEAAEPTPAPPGPVAKPQPPAPEVPEGWQAIWDKAHEEYYYWKTSTQRTTWSLEEVQREATEERERREKVLQTEAETWNRPCKTQEECLLKVDEFLNKQPRQANLLLRTYGPTSLGGGDCGEACSLAEPCPTDPILPGCRYDTYDNSIAAIYLTKRGNLVLAQSILDNFVELLYPKSLEGIGKEVLHAGPSGRPLTLLAAAYSDAGKAEAGKYESDGVYDGAVDTGNNAWAALAFVHYAAAANAPCYAEVARDILSALGASGACGDELGGFAGRREPYPRNYRSTEHNIDVSALARLLGDDEVWGKAQLFVRSMFGRNQKYNSSYSMGTGDDKQCDPSQPEAPVPADCTYWNILADADPDKGRMSAALAFAMQTPQPQEPPKEGIRGPQEDPDVQRQQGMWSQDEDLMRPVGHPFYGSRFSTWGNGVQWEVTAGAAMAMLHFSKKYGKLVGPDGKEVDLDAFVDQVRDSVRLLLGMYGGVPGSILGGNREAWVQWTLRQDKWRRNVAFPGGTDTGVSWSYLRYPHVASTAWVGLMLLYQGEKGGPVNEDANPLGPPAIGVPKDTSDLSCLDPASKPPSTTTAPPSAQDSEVLLWKAWREHFVEEQAHAAARARPRPQEHIVVNEGATAQASGITAVITVPKALGGDLGLGVGLDRASLTVRTVQDAEAKGFGWRVGDRLVAVAGQPVKSSADLEHALAPLLAGAGAEDALPTKVTVLRMDLCQHSCAEVVRELGSSCSSTWKEGCPGASPPPPFAADSVLAELCPAECGEAPIKGAWTHQFNPGEEVVLISGGRIHWQSGRKTVLVPEDDSESAGQQRRFAANFQGQMYHGTLFGNGTIIWSDGDCWLRVGGPQMADATAQGPEATELVADARVAKLGISFAAAPAGHTRIKGVLPGSWAASKGIAHGDEVVEVNGQKVAAMTTEAFQKVLRQRPLKLKLLKAEGGVTEETRNDWLEWKRQHQDADDAELKAWLAWRKSYDQDPEGGHKRLARAEGGAADDAKELTLRYLAGVTTAEFSLGQQSDAPASGPGATASSKEARSTRPASAGRGVERAGAAVVAAMMLAVALAGAVAWRRQNGSYSSSIRASFQPVLRGSSRETAAEVRRGWLRKFGPVGAVGGGRARGHRGEFADELLGQSLE